MKIRWIKLTLHGLGGGAGIKKKKFIKHLAQIWYIDDIGYILLDPDLNLYSLTNWSLISWILKYVRTAYVTIIRLLCRLNEMAYKLSNQHLVQIVGFQCLSSPLP